MLKKLKIKKVHEYSMHVSKIKKVHEYSILMYFNSIYKGNVWIQHRTLQVLFFAIHSLQRIYKYINIKDFILHYRRLFGVSAVSKSFSAMIINYEKTTNKH